jgi:CDP-diacylglycerol--glycerol-3-phosphate 3-phosphatidyltransferase
MTLANKITLTRIALIPVFVILMCIGGQGCTIAALILFLITSATDFLDGYVARKYNQITDFGKFVDPLADKLLVTAALCMFVQQDLISGALVWIILAREFIITSLRTIAALKGEAMAAAWSGKVKTCVQIAGIVVIFLCSIAVNGEMTGMASTLCLAAGWIMTLVTLYSGYDYLKRNWALVADGATKKK